VTDQTASAPSPVDSGPGRIVLAQVMLPTDANAQGNVHGGTLMKLADTAGAIAAMRHAGRRVVTAMMDSMTFHYQTRPDRSPAGRLTSDVTIGGRLAGPGGLPRF
jgi:acyl-CoA hydrolase